MNKVNKTKKGGTILIFKAEFKSRCIAKGTGEGCRVEYFESVYDSVFEFLVSSYSR